MKNIFFLIVLSALMPCIGNAQRQADLSIELLNPKTSDTIYSDNPLAIDVSIQNNGVDTFRGTDTLIVEIIIDGIYLEFDVAGVTKKHTEMSHITLNPNGSKGLLQWSFPQFLSWNSGQSEICIIIKPRNLTNTISDNTLSNNSSCSKILISEGVAINDVKQKTLSNVRLFPNPNIGEFTLKALVSPNQLHKIEIFNVTGKLLYKKEISASSNELIIPLELDHLPKGVYTLMLTELKSLQSESTRLLVK